MGTGKDSLRIRHAAPAVYEQIIDSLASGVLALDKDGRVLVANAAACDHLELPCGTIQRGAFVDELPLPAAFLLKLHTVLNEHRPLDREEVVVPRENGEKKELGFSASLLEGPEPFNGAVFLFVDMTERRALERAAELNRQLAQIGQLIAGVVHEIAQALSASSAARPNCSNANSKKTVRTANGSRPSSRKRSTWDAPSPSSSGSPVRSSLR